MPRDDREREAAIRAECTRQGRACARLGAPFMAWPMALPAERARIATEAEGSPLAGLALTRGPGSEAVPRALAVFDGRRVERTGPKTI